MRASSVFVALLLVACHESANDVSASPSTVADATEPEQPTAAIEQIEQPTAAIEPTEATEAATNDPQWHALVRSIAARYWTWGLVDDQARWAPGLCAMPTPGSARISRSGDPRTHGDKVYVLYAKDPAGYGFPPGKPYFSADEQIPGRGRVPPPDPALDRVGQVVVKESFVPRELQDDHTWHPGELRVLPATKDNKIYGPGDPLGLYLMAKVDADLSAATDEGWIYATITTEGEVTSAGRVSSCMGCHERNEDRLFGLDSGK